LVDGKVGDILLLHFIEMENQFPFLAFSLVFQFLYMAGKKFYHDRTLFEGAVSEAGPEQNQKKRRENYVKGSVEFFPRGQSIQKF